MTREVPGKAGRRHSLGQVDQGRQQAIGRWDILMGETDGPHSEAGGHKSAHHCWGW